MINIEALAKPPFKQFEVASDGFFKMFPNFPKSWMKFLARITPILALLGGIANVISLLKWNYFSPTYMAAQLISAILLLVAYKPLSIGRKIGLTYLFWSSVFHAVLNLTWDFSASVVLSLGIGLYLIQQLRPHFTKK